MHDFDLTVIEFIREYGADALYIKQVNGDYDPSTGTVANTEKRFPVKGILLDFTLQSNGLKTKYGTEILAGDKQYFMQPPNKTTPGSPLINIDPTKDSIKAGNVQYSIVTFKEINPTGFDPIVYELVLRR